MMYKSVNLGKLFSSMEIGFGTFDKDQCNLRSTLADNNGPFGYIGTDYLII